MDLPDRSTVAGRLSWIEISIGGFGSWTFAWPWNSLSCSSRPRLYRSWPVSGVPFLPRLEARFRHLLHPSMHRDCTVPAFDMIMLVPLLPGVVLSKDS